jgi:hypothetical protein
MEGRRSGSPGGMKWQVRYKREKFGKLQVVFICFKLGASVSDQSRNEVQACRGFFVGQTGNTSKKALSR